VHPAALTMTIPAIPNCHMQYSVLR
jgi:hypothetical protein